MWRGGSHSVSHGSLAGIRRIFSHLFDLNKKEIATIDELDVTPTSCILSLSDAIGELKRSVYDKIRQGDAANAESTFLIMESLYVLISPFATYYNIVQGIKRKLDIARMLVEDTRSTVTRKLEGQIS